MKHLGNGELMQQAAEWISDSISAHYEFGGDAPGENDGKRLCGELYERAGKVRLLGNGEGFTTLTLTDAESRLIRAVLGSRGPGEEARIQAAVAYDAGIMRATDRIKSEFDQEQKARKATK